MTSRLSATADTLSTLAQQAADARYGGADASLLDTLGQIRLVELAAEQYRRAVVATLREEGMTWALIGDALGTTRQAAQQRYGAR